MQPVLWWVRHDIRVADNPALCWSAARGPVVPIYIFDETDDDWAMGGAARWWLYHALDDFAVQCRAVGLNLILRRGDPSKILNQLILETGAKTLTWGRCYEPHSIKRDKAIKADLQGAGITVESHKTSLLFEPWEIATGSGTPYKVYTPFSKACFAKGVEAPLPVPKSLKGYSGILSDRLDDWGLLPHRPDWATGLRAFWHPTQKGGAQRLSSFIKDKITNYKTMRDRPDHDATSCLSPYLRFGQLGPRQVWHKIVQEVAHKPEISVGAECYMRELLWREFSYHLLFHFPDLPEKPFQAKFASFPWHKNETTLQSWQRGMTGYPIVDAGMRQLWQTGWMHNRVRMIVASFLIKDLLLPWQDGEAWFWDTLVDADLASNSAGWQWVAGSGADAAPYFRIFNPVLQGKKFDPDGHYIRRYVPELEKLPVSCIHEPWTAPKNILSAAGVEIGKTYPSPIIDHAVARDRALEALATVSQ